MPGQARQANFGRRVTRTWNLAGITSSRSDVSVPISTRAPLQQGQVVASGASTTSTRGRCAGNRLRPARRRRTIPSRCSGEVLATAAAASVLATVDGKGQRDGRAVEVVRGVLAGQGELRPYDPGEVPSARPPESFWGDRYFELPVFAPPRIDPRGETGIPHLGLDAVLAELLGDVL